MSQGPKVSITQYYDRCIKNNRLWWDLNRSHAIHAGYWDETTHTLSEALNRENEILAKAVNIKPNDHVLDAGCGVGGSSLYLAGHIGCQVTGIDLGEHLIELAVHAAEEAKLSSLIKFHVMDFTSTTFPDASFDVIWALESICHIKDKNTFIKEAWRLLKNKGRLVLADGFQSKDDYSDSERQTMSKAQNLLGTCFYETVGLFKEKLKAHGFQNISIQDASKNILPSSRRLYYYSFPLIAWSKLGEYFGWSSVERTQDFKGYYYQYKPLKTGLNQYLIIHADKP